MSAFDRASAPQLPLDTTTGAVSTDDSACTTLLTPPPLPPANSASGQQSRASITTIAPTAGSKFRAFSADDGADRALNPDSLHRELSRPPVLDHPISLLSAAWSADNTLPVPLDDVERDRARTVKDKAILEASASSENAVDLDSLSTHLSSLDIGPLTRSTSSRQNHARWEGVGDTTGAATDGGRTIPKHVWDDRLLGVFRVLLYFFGVLPLSWPKLRASSFFRRTAQVVDVIAGNLAPAIVLFVISFMLVREFYIPYYLYTAERIAWICTRLAALTAWWVGFRYLRQRKFLHGAIESVHKQCHSYAIFRAKYASSNLQVRSTGVASENHLAGAPTAISLDDSESLATRRVRSPTTVREEEDTRKNSEFGVTKPSPLTRDIVRQLDLPTVQLETRYISRLAKTHTGVALFIGCIMYIPLSLREFGWSRVTRGNSDVGVQDWVLANATGQVYWAFLGVAGAVNILLPVVIASALSMLVHLLYWRIKRLLDVVKTIELFELPADMLPWISMMRQRIISDGSQISSAFFWPFVVLTGLLLLGPVILFVTLIATNGEHPHISHFAAGLGCFSLLCVLTASIQKLINAELELIRRANLLLQRGYAPAIAAGAPSTAATGGHPSGPGSHQRVRSISEAPARLLVAHVQANPALATRMQSVVSKPKTEVAAAEAATSTTDAIELPLKRVQEDRSLQGVASQYTAGSKLLDGQAAENAQIMRQEKRAPTSNTVDSAPNHPSSSAHADEPASSRQVTFSASASSSVTAGAADDDATAFLTESDRHELEQHRSETSEKQLIPMTSSDGGASNPVAKHVKRSGSSLLALISVVFKRQWRDAFIFLTIWLCYIIFRLFVGYPVCWNPTGNKGYCSDAEDTIRLVETAVTGHCNYTVFWYFVALVYGGRTFAASLKWMYILCAAGMIGLTIAVRAPYPNEHDPGWWDVHTNLINISCVVWTAHKLSQLPMYRERPSAAWLIIPPLILGSIYNVVQTYVITEVYTSSSNRGRIVVVLAFQPVVAQLLLKLAEVCSHFMVKWIPSLADHAFYFPWAALQMLTSMIGRVYLSNLSSLGDQLLSALLLMLIEVSIRITRPLRTYIMWRGLCLSHEDAMHKARASHLGLTHRHTEYLGQFGQICSIVIATVFSVVVRAQYGISQPAGVIIGSVLVQLVVAFLGDFLSIIVQCWYLGMNLGFWYRHQKSGLYLRTFLYTVPLAALFVKDAMQIVLSTSDYTHEG